jgi:hypothetical protein
MEHPEAGLETAVGGNMAMYNPPHPGEIIREFCVEPLNINITEAAKVFETGSRSGISELTLSVGLLR